MDQDLILEEHHNEVHAELTKQLKFYVFVFVGEGMIPPASNSLPHFLKNSSLLT
jgi:hypothetical protein